MHPSGQEFALDRIMGTIFKMVGVCAVAPSLAVNKGTLDHPEPWGEWRETECQAFVLDEAGNMTKADAVRATGNSDMTMCMFGDDDQLKPTVMSSQDKLGDDSYHRHVPEAEMSPLKWAKVHGCPVFVMRTQFRMAKGMYDMTQAVSYPNEPSEYRPVLSDITHDCHRPGRLLSEFMKEKWPLLRNPPADMLWSTFLDTQGTITNLNTKTGAKSNSRQVKIGLKLISSFIAKKGVNPSSCRIICPYKANVVYAERIRKGAEFAALRGVPSATEHMPESLTVESSQGAPQRRHLSPNLRARCHRRPLCCDYEKVQQGLCYEVARRARGGGVHQGPAALRLLPLVLGAWTGSNDHLEGVDTGAGRTALSRTDFVVYFIR